MISEPSPVRNMPRFLIGAIIGVFGLYGLVFEENWNDLFGKLIGQSNLQNQLIYGLVDVLPLVIIFIGGAMMLSARKPKMDEEAS